jgi:hypothetical protein
MAKKQTKSKPTANTTRNNRLFALLAAVLVLIIGYVILRTSAATPYASLEAESGTRTANASVVADTTASGGSALLFGNGTTSPPSGPRSCPPYPAFPDATCTGVLPGIARTNTGSFQTTSDGQVIENLNVDGRITVNHNNVLIRNVKFTSRGTAISILQKTGLVVEDCEIDGTGATNGDPAIVHHNYTMRRCNIHSIGEGPRANENVVLEDNYMHSFTSFVAQGAHQDCIQITSGTNIVIRHNTCLMNVDGGNAAIMTGSFSGDNLLEKNLLAGGGYVVYCGDNLRVLNNHFSTMYHPKGGYWGLYAYCETVTRTGNVWHDGPKAGQPAN